MEIVGLRELRQNASDLVRRVEEGEEITITVAGRPGAKLVPRRGTHLAALDRRSRPVRWDGRSRLGFRPR